MKLKGIPAVREWGVEDHTHGHGVSITKSSKKTTIEEEEGVSVVVTQEEVKYELNQFDYII